jgi:hypothetical protein
MKSEELPKCELIYEADIRFTRNVEYGVSMEALSSRKIPIPPQGARFDQEFNGELHGPKLRGTISGTDYLCVRADGLFQLHLHARLTTEDGVNIAISSRGVSLEPQGKKETQLRAAVSLFTSAEAYGWVNRLQLWAVGTLDPETGTAQVRAYAV